MSKVTKQPGAVLYSRVSTDEQVNNTSLGSQLDACITKAEALGLPIIATHTDPGISGARFESRPGLQAALADIEQGRADTLISLDLDRLSRVVKHQQEIKERVEKAGGRLIFCTETFADDEGGDLHFTMSGTFKAYERKVFRARTMRGRRRAAQEGVQTARGWSPYGYTIPTRAHVLRGEHRLEDMGKYLINEPEAEVVRWLFQAYAAGEYSLPGLARELNRRGVPTKMGAQGWHPPTIRNIFLSRTYIGEPAFGRLTCRTDEARLSQIRPLTGQNYKTPDVRRPSAPEDIIPLSAPPLIDQATFDRVQERLQTNKARRGGNPLRAHMLSGVVKCERCGSPMYMCAGGDPVKGYPPYYQCGSYRQKRAYLNEAICSPESFKIPVAEGGVVRSIEDATLHPDWIKAALAEFRQTRPAAPVEETRRELKATEKALGELRAQEEAVVQAQIAGIRAGASVNAYATVFAEIAESRKGLEERRDTLSRALAARRDGDAAPRTSDGELTAQVLENVRRVLTSPHVTDLEKREAVMMVVERVHCRKDGALVTFLPGLFGGDTLQEVSVSFFK